jgi:hypothetical protein
MLVGCSVGSDREAAASTRVIRVIKGLLTSSSEGIETEKGAQGDMVLIYNVT